MKVNERYVNRSLEFIRSHRNPRVVVTSECFERVIEVFFPGANSDEVRNSASLAYFRFLREDLERGSKVSLLARIGESTVTKVIERNWKKVGFFLEVNVEDARFFVRADPKTKTVKTFEIRESILRVLGRNAVGCAYYDFESEISRSILEKGFAILNE